MAKPAVGTTDLDLSEPAEQPETLKELLRSISIARKHTNLYGFDHPSTPGCFEDLARAMQDFQESFGRVTCVFIKAGVIVNDFYFAPSVDSLDLCRRLTDRGVMALTFAENWLADQVQGFLSFLAADPSEVRHNGGPSVYLRKRGVSRIIATEAVYPGADESNEEDAAASGHPGDVDPAIAAALDWLSRHDDDSSPSPGLPLVEILSHPDRAAKLIREAVTKLHASRRGYTDRELSTEVIHELKELAATDPERWDAAAPRIRKAISELPPEIRPGISMFTFESSGARLPTNRADLKVVGTDEIEKILSEAFDPQAAPAPGEVAAGTLEKLFDITAVGLIASWRQELDPTSFLRSSSNTLESLIAWEKSAPDHARIAGALAALIPQALEIGDTAAALRCAAILIGQATSQSEQEWRRTNATSVIEMLERPVLHALVDQALEQEEEAGCEIAAKIIETVPGLSVDMVGMLGSNLNTRFNEALRKAVTVMSGSTLEPLGVQLRRGTPAARVTALELLVEIGNSGAARQIAQALEGADTSFAIKALSALSTMRFQVATEACAKVLSSREAEVRAAALAGLNRLRDASALPKLMRFASGRLNRRAIAEERISAIQTLGEIGNEETAKWLKRLANRRIWFGRSRRQPIRIAAEQAVAAIRYRQRTVEEQVAQKAPYDNE